MDTRTESKTFSSERRIAMLVHSAIAGASIAATLELASRETLSLPLLVALGCFAIAVPAAIALVILSEIIYELGKETRLNEGLDRQHWPVLSYVLAVADQITCYLGFLLIFWNFHWIIGMIFLIATILAFATTWMAEKSMQKTETRTAEADTT